MLTTSDVREAPTWFQELLEGWVVLDHTFRAWRLGLVAEFYPYMTCLMT